MGSATAEQHHVAGSKSHWLESGVAGQWGQPARPLEDDVERGEARPVRTVPSLRLKSSIALSMRGFVSRMTSLSFITGVNSKW